MENKKISVGKIDCNGNEIFVGDVMNIPKHSGCCQHIAKCIIAYNKNWGAYGLKEISTEEWISGMGIVSGYPKMDV
jgi:hypothetical protein